LCLTLGLQPAAWVVLWVARSPSLVVALLPIWWAGIVAYVLALGAAVAVQRDRRNAGRSSWRPRTVLWVGWLATFVGGAGFLVPALVWWGAWRDRRRTDAARAPMTS
jgi:hypothetical protein